MTSAHERGERTERLSRQTSIAPMLMCAGIVVELILLAQRFPFPWAASASWHSGATRQTAFLLCDVINYYH